MQGYTRERERERALFIKKKRERERKRAIHYIRCEKPAV